MFSLSDGGGKDLAVITQRPMALSSTGSHSLALMLHRCCLLLSRVLVKDSIRTMCTDPLPTPANLATSGFGKQSVIAKQGSENKGSILLHVHMLGMLWCAHLRML